MWWLVLVVGCAGLDPSQLEWLAGLVRSRLLVAMPMTNSIGYDHNTRYVPATHSLTHSLTA